jgi:hypothetical protein
MPSFLGLGLRGGTLLPAITFASPKVSSEKIRKK